MTHSRPSQLELAAGLAARLLHDLSGPATGIMSGVDLLADEAPAELRAAGVELATASARALLDTLDFCRAAFGGSAELHDSATLERLASSRFAGHRAQLKWPAAMPALTATAAQCLLIMTQIAAGALARGRAACADASCDAELTILAVDVDGDRASIDPAARDGLTGRRLGEGLLGRWAPGAYLRAVVQDSGGTLSIDDRGGGFQLKVLLPNLGGPANRAAPPLF